MFPLSSYMPPFNFVEFVNTVNVADGFCLLKWSLFKSITTDNSSKEISQDSRLISQGPL